MIPHPTVEEAQLGPRDGGGLMDPPRSLAEAAYSQLVKKITRLEYPPGQLLLERALVADLEIGRTPIREALQRLAVEGLTQRLPGRGMLVSEISATSVRHIYEFRAIIDGHTARLAATRASPDEVSHLARLQQQLVLATEADDVDNYVDYDRAFYGVLADAAQNVYLAEVVPRIFNLHLRLWFFISKKIGNWHDVAHSHEEMTAGVVSALRSKDPDAAELAMKTYISRRHEDIRSVL